MAHQHQPIFGCVFILVEVIEVGAHLPRDLNGAGSEAGEDPLGPVIIHKRLLLVREKQEILQDVDRIEHYYRLWRDDLVLLESALFSKLHIPYGE